MRSEDLKKQFLTSRDLFTAKRWEGKPWAFKIRYFYANHPEFFFSTFVFLFIIPPLAYYRYYSYPGSKREAITKYKADFTVVRDDHPRIAEIIEEKERGRHFFPQ